MPFITHICSIKSFFFFIFNLDVLLLILNQANHRFTTRMQRRIYGHATDVAIRPLDEEKAVQAAADLLGELFVFTVLSLSHFPLLGLDTYSSLLGL